MSTTPGIWMAACCLALLPSCLQECTWGRIGKVIENTYYWPLPYAGEIAYIDTGFTTGSAQGSATFAGEESVRVRGSYGTKLESVLRRIMHVTEADATSKVRDSGLVRTVRQG